MLSMLLGIKHFEHLALKPREAVQGARELSRLSLIFTSPYRRLFEHHPGVSWLKVTHLMLGAEGLLALQKLGVDPSVALDAINGPLVCTGMGQTGGMPWLSSQVDSHVNSRFQY